MAEEEKKDEQKQNSMELGKAMFGRRVIYSDQTAITPSNVVDVVEQAYLTHLVNQSEIEYLWNYYKGKQPILYRKREIRDELTQHVVENRANEIVSFKVGYMVGKPITYVSSDSEKKISDTVNKLNKAMKVIGKHTKDKELVEWMMICGVGYRYVVQNNDRRTKSPFNLYTLDPRETFVIRANDYTKRVIAAVNYVADQNGNIVFTVFTDDYCYTIPKDTRKETHVRNTFGLIPIIEYPANNAREGCFEIVLTMLDSINKFDSARLEAVEQFVQSLLVLTNCQLEDGVTADSIREAGMILLKSVGDNKASIENLAEQLDQSQNQTLKDDLYQAVLQIVGVPSQTASGTSDSSNNGAVVLKNGWQGAETRAEDFETMFQLPEQEMLQVVSVICESLSDLSFDTSEMEVKFTRRNYENILSKSQTLTTMLGNDKVHPKCAYEASGLFADTEEAYQMGMDWMKQQEAKQEKAMQQTGVTPNAKQAAV